jgi:NAD(P)H-dependent flavin oxidoreductase YrpB (nitropropane dioxygenase family)
VPDGFPVLLAAALPRGPTSNERSPPGAAAVVLGTRFVMSEEANAARAYKQR